MIEYLEKLVEDGEYKKALDYANQLLLNHTNSALDVMRINQAAMMCRYRLGELHGALVSAQLALKQASDLEQWDCYGQATHVVALVHYLLRQYDLAMNYWFDYITHFDKYSSARKYEIIVWYNQGVVNVLRGDIQPGLEAYAKALEAAKRTGDPRDAQGLRHALVGAYLKINEFERIPPILAKCLHFLRNNPTILERDASWMWHYRLRAEFAIKTKRLARAYKVAVRSLRRSNGNQKWAYHANMTLAKVILLLGRASEALSYAIAARYNAIQCKRYDLEYEAAEFMYEIMHLQDDTSYHSLGLELPLDSSTSVIELHWKQ